MNTRQHFFSLLTQPLPAVDFRGHVTHLLAHDPLFIPGYIEHIRYAEQMRDTRMYAELLTYTERVLSRIILDSDSQKYIIDNWSDYEIKACNELFQRQKHFTKNPFHKLLLQMYAFIFSYVIKPCIKTRSVETSDTYLFREKTLDSKPFQKEVSALSPCWWNINTVRAQTNTYHRETSVILLRERVENTEAFVQRSGVHESKETMHAKRFPKIHEAVIAFAAEQNLGLGRIALVRLAPYAYAYRHFDDEIYTYLKGRRRYHFVIKAGTQNELSAGTDTVHPQPGEIWYINNGVMHYAYNNSKEARIHVVFDGYPLENVNTK